MNRLTLTLAGLTLLAVAACAVVSQTDSTSIAAVLTQLGNTLTTDLSQQKAVALAATPPDADGAQCVGALPNPAVAGDTGTGALARAKDRPPRNSKASTARSAA